MPQHGMATVTNTAMHAITNTITNEVCEWLVQPLTQHEPPRPCVPVPLASPQLCSGKLGSAARGVHHMVLWPSPGAHRCGPGHQRIWLRTPKRPPVCQGDGMSHGMAAAEISW